MARKRSSPAPEIPADDSDHVDAEAASDNDEQSIESNPQNDVAEEQNEEESQEQEDEDDAESEGEGEGEAEAEAEGEGEDGDEAPVNPDDQSIEKEVSSQGSESIGKESGSASGSGSDSESEKASPVPVKPIRSKPMKILSKKPDPKVDPKPKRKRASVKRPAETDRNGRGGSKKARVSNGDEKRSGINRLWSEEDEIVILQGLIDYQLANDEDPYSDLEAFYDFVKDSLHVSVSVKQLSDKIRRLKKKYLVNAEKGADVVFVKPHEDKSYELSKKIWGGGNGEDGSKVKAGRKKKDKEIGKAVSNGVNGKKIDVVMEDEVENEVEVDEDEDEGLDFKAMYKYLSQAWESDVTCSQPLKEISVGNFRLIGSEKARAMDKEWKDVYVNEMQLYVKKLALKSKHAKVVLDQMINSDP